MVETVSADEVKQSIENDRAAVVNVLPREYFEDEHIPNSMNLTMKITDGEEERNLEEFDKDGEIIVHCASASCESSQVMAETLESIGFKNVKDYEEGIAGWKDHGYEVESAN